MHRRTHNRHAPPNAMLNHFWQKIPSFWPCGDAITAPRNSRRLICSTPGIRNGETIALQEGRRTCCSIRSFLVIGAYPEDGTYDECTDTRDRIEAAKRIAKTRRPDADPIFGKNGPLTRLWRGGTR
jgi:hypothetical protein